jgi:hypothetical protein
LNLNLLTLERVWTLDGPVPHKKDWEAHDAEESLGFKVPDTERTDQHLSQPKENPFKVHCKYGLKASAHESESLHLAKVGLLLNLRFLTPLQD